MVFRLVEEQVPEAPQDASLKDLLDAKHLFIVRISPDILSGDNVPRNQQRGIPVLAGCWYDHDTDLGSFVKFTDYVAMEEHTRYKSGFEEDNLLLSRKISTFGWWNSDKFDFFDSNEYALDGEYPGSIRQELEDFGFKFGQVYDF